MPTGEPGTTAGCPHTTPFAQSQITPFALSLVVGCKYQPAPIAWRCGGCGGGRVGVGRQPCGAGRFFRIRGNDGEHANGLAVDLFTQGPRWLGVLYVYQADIAPHRALLDSTAQHGPGGTEAGGVTFAVNQLFQTAFDEVGPSALAWRIGARVQGSSLKLTQLPPATDGWPFARPTVVLPRATKSTGLGAEGAWRSYLELQALDACVRARR